MPADDSARVIARAGLIALLAVVASTTAAHAAEPWFGCYARSYSRAAPAPARNVQSLAVELWRSPTSDSDILHVEIAASIAGKLWINSAFCRERARTMTCHIEDSETTLRLTRTAKGLRIHAPHGFTVGLGQIMSFERETQIGGRRRPVLELPAGKPEACERPAEAPFSKYPWRGCFLRTFTKPDLASTPPQRLKLLSLSLSPWPERPDTYYFGITAVHSSVRQAKSDHGECRPENDGLACQLSRGGRVFLRRAESGLELENPARLELEAERSNDILTLEGEHERVFQVPRTKDRICF